MRFYQPLIVLIASTWKSATCELRGTGYEDKLFSLSTANKAHCPKECTYGGVTSKMAADQERFMKRTDVVLHKYSMTLVSETRRRTTALLTKSAIMSCVPGDIVETGVFNGGTSAVIMRILMDFDGCGRKFWAFDSFEGIPL